ncbi:protein-disulfide isomerase [Psychrobium sp. MM17-31]|uniref:protein-disulfide isomerase n=1 Tax=Psychrobium sp. MM17-31 TaxID=2917758 RepID=UPI001EF62F68|nr:protein-disulfide isomerase [Psychrobium sp. MM17-31]MCG7531608.1 protein-disulfide isomerase [Psychrobium sp. MM17-31]
MNSQLYFVYDSHCPWSYACLPLIKAIANSDLAIDIHFMHAAHYNGSDGPAKAQLKTVIADSNISFGAEYSAQVSQSKDATLMANTMAWLVNKQPKQALAVLSALMEEHFQHNKSLANKAELTATLESLKLSPPGKIFKDKLSADAMQIVEDVNEIQELIGMRSFPIMLLAMGDNAVLLDHSHYLKHPDKIVEAIKLEL